MSLALDSTLLGGLPGTVLGTRYRIEELLGEGGMGAVYRARHLGLQRDVAVKVLHPELFQDPAQLQRFEREARAAGRLAHPNVVHVADFGTGDGLAYLVMELTPGRDLAALVQEGPLPSARVVEIGAQILAGLAHAHAHGIVHRDLKPENIRIIEHDGALLVKLLDFGIAHVFAGEGSGQNLTQTGLVFGTPQYMSPEQALGEKGDPRSDLYALGVILYELLVGTPPFVAEDGATLLRMHMNAPPPALPAHVPPGLADLVMRLLAKSPNDRYANAEATIVALRASLLAPPPPSAPALAPAQWGATVPPRSPAALPRALTIAGLVVLAAMLAAWWASS